MLHQSSLRFDKPSPVLEKNNEPMTRTSLLDRDRRAASASLTHEKSRRR
jgi:hypothetical protein